MSRIRSRPGRAGRPTVSMATVVWGLLVLALGVLTLAGLLVPLTLDPVLTAAGVLLVGGLLLVISAAFSRRSDQDRDRAATPHP